MVVGDYQNGMIPSRSDNSMGTKMKNHVHFSIFPYVQYISSNPLPDDEEEEGRDMSLLLWVVVRTSSLIINKLGSSLAVSSRMNR